ncbi:uncharacterized protein [Phyllobates terribilis]|uniref:uncharacterized protein n=1 Tax=Phyllobates terribilis TaxID=111132 RepID=UPI003CCB1F4E
MNPLTLVKRIQKMNSREADLGISEDASWHAKYKDSAYVFVGGIPYDLTEGDLLAIFAQYGELVDVNLVRDKTSGKSKGFAFVAYEDQRSTNLAVDNLNGAQVMGRTIRVDHVSKYKKKEEEDEEEELKKREERGVCRAFQKGECTRGSGCKFSHNEQRAANTGWGDEEDRLARLGHDKFKDEVKDRPKKEERGVCRAFQRGDCTRGAGCKFSHDEQRAEDDKRSRLRPVDIPSRHKADGLDAGRSRRREDESYRKVSEIDHKDRHSRDKRKQLEVREKVVYKEDRDSRGADRNSSRDEKRSRRHDMEEYHPRENRDERERGKEKRSYNARDSSSIRSRDRDDDDD